MLQQADWKSRHAALMAISASSEGCHKQMEPLLDQVMDCVMNFIASPTPGSGSPAATPSAKCLRTTVFKKKFHAKVIPGLLMLMQDSANPRVQAHSGATLVNCPKNILLPYLPDFMNRLEEVLTAKFHKLVQKGNKLVLEQIVTTIASVADTAEEKFVEYYEEAGLA